MRAALHHAIAATAIATVAVAPAASALAGSERNEDGDHAGTVTICHRTNGGHFDRISVDADSTQLTAHRRHDGDLIPAPADACPNTTNCAKAKLPCDRIPEVPAHWLTLLAMAIGAAGTGAWARWRRGDR